MNCSASTKQSIYSWNRNHSHKNRCQGTRLLLHSEISTSFSLFQVKVKAEVTVGTEPSVALLRNHRIGKLPQDNQPHPQPRPVVSAALPSARPPCLGVRPVHVTDNQIKTNKDADFRYSFNILSSFLETKAGCKLGRSASTSGVPSPMGTPQRHAPDASANQCGTPFQVQPPYSSEWARDRMRVEFGSCLRVCRSAQLYLHVFDLWPHGYVFILFCLLLLLPCIPFVSRRSSSVYVDAYVCVVCVRSRSGLPSHRALKRLSHLIRPLWACQEIHNKGFIYQAVLALEKRSESECEALQSAGGQLYSRPAASSSLCRLYRNVSDAVVGFLRCTDIKHRSC